MGTIVPSLSFPAVDTFAVKGSPALVFLASMPLSMSAARLTIIMTCDGAALSAWGVLGVCAATHETEARMTARVAFCLSIVTSFLFLRTLLGVGRHSILK